MGSISDQSIVNPEPHIVLLYPTTYRQQVQLSTFVEADVFNEFKSLQDATVGNLVTLIFNTWNESTIGLDKPTNPAQIRLIHLGRQLDDKSLQLSELKLNLSEIIHVTVRPLESLQDSLSTKITKKVVSTEKSSGCCVIC